MRVVDDEPAILDVFREICQREGLALQTFQAAGPFLASLGDDAPGCVVLDLNLPDRPGLEVLAAMAAAGCPLPVVCMSGRAGVHDAVAAFKLGSLDFVEKPFALGAIVATLHRAIDTDRERRARDGALRELRARFQSMTRREREVMDLVVSGLPNKLIATRLGVSPKTVEVHRAHVMQKSRAGSLAELVRLSIAAGIVPTWREPVAS